jgi:excisionase family DNA binding protein
MVEKQSQQKQGIAPATTRPLWTTSEVAAYLRVPVATIYKWRQTDYGPRGYRLGKHVMFDPDDVAAWLVTRREGA